MPFSHPYFSPSYFPKTRLFLFPIFSPPCQRSDLLPEASTSRYTILCFPEPYGSIRIRCQYTMCSRPAQEANVCRWEERMGSKRAPFRGRWPEKVHKLWAGKAESGRFSFDCTICKNMVSLTLEIVHFFRQNRHKRCKYALSQCRSLRPDGNIRSPWQNSSGQIQGNTAIDMLELQRRRFTLPSHD